MHPGHGTWAEWLQRVEGHRARVECGGVGAVAAAAGRWLRRSAQAPAVGPQSNLLAVRKGTARGGRVGPDGFAENAV